MLKNNEPTTLRSGRRTMMAQMVSTLALAAFAIFGTACGGGSGQSTVAGQPAGQVSGGTAVLRMQNTSNTDIYYIHMSPSEQSTWGPDLLGREILRIGQTFTIQGITPGNWDVRVVDRDGLRKEVYNVYFGDGQHTDVVIDSEGWLPPDGQH